MVRTAMISSVAAAIALMASGAAQAADAVAGKAVFTSQCSTCHVVVKGANTTVGPNLFGVAGRKAGSTTFAYSPAMKAAGFKWTADKLTAYITSPATTVPGNKMPFGGVKDAAKVANLVAYLQTVK
jgi:cytochrome c